MGGKSFFTADSTQGAALKERFTSACTPQAAPTESGAQADPSATISPSVTEAPSASPTTSAPAESTGPPPTSQSTDGAVIELD